MVTSASRIATVSSILVSALVAQAQTVSRSGAEVCDEIQGYSATMVAEEGDVAPGTNGSHFTSLNTKLVVNDQRQVAFWADTSTVEGIFLWEDGTMASRALQHAPVPGTGQIFGSVYKEIAMNNDGTIVFSATLSGGDDGLFQVSYESEIGVIVVDGDPIPGFDATFNEGQGASSVAAGITDSGEVYFRGVMDGASKIGDNGALFRYADGAFSVVAASGLECPGIGILEAITAGPNVSPDGSVVFRANDDGLDLLIRYRDGLCEELVREGEAAPGSGCFVHFPGSGTPSPTGNAYFRARLGCGPEARSLFKYDFSGSLTVLIRDGDDSPLPGSSFFHPGSGGEFDNVLGQVFFHSQLSGGNTIAGSFRLDQPSNAIVPLLLADAPAPCVDGELLDDLGIPRNNNVGDWVASSKATDQIRRILLYTCTECECQDPDGCECEDLDGDGRVTICHVPPGMPDNSRTITVSVRAVPAHLAHGDTCGPCDRDNGLLMLGGQDKVAPAIVGLEDDRVADDPAHGISLVPLN